MSFKGSGHIAWDTRSALVHKYGWGTTPKTRRVVTIDSLASVVCMEALGYMWYRHEDWPDYIVWDVDSNDAYNILALLKEEGLVALKGWI